VEATRKCKWQRRQVGKERRWKTEHAVDENMTPDTEAMPPDIYGTPFSGCLLMDGFFTPDYENRLFRS